MYKVAEKYSIRMDLFGVKNRLQKQNRVGRLWMIYAPLLYLSFFEQAFISKVHWCDLLFVAIALVMWFGSFFGNKGRLAAIKRIRAAIVLMDEIESQQTEKQAREVAFRAAEVLMSIKTTMTNQEIAWGVGGTAVLFAVALIVWIIQTLL